MGVVVYTLLCGYEPFYGETEQELLQANKTVNYEFLSPDFDHISADAIDFIRSAMESDPQKRLTLQGALQHRWLSDIHPQPKKRKSAKGKCTIS